MPTLFLVAIFAGCLGGDSSAKDIQLEPVKVGGKAKASAVFEGIYRFDGSYSYTLVTGTLGYDPIGQLVEVPSKVLLTNPNGRITMGLWLPKGAPEGTKFPVIVDAGPYYGNGDVVATQPAGRLGKFLIENFVPHGYAVAQLSVRGTGNHGGCMDLMGAAEQSDLSTAIEWLGTQPWSNGNVGMIGRSYDGSTPWEVAAQGNKYLKTIVPISGLSDFFGLMTYNGTSESRAPGVIHALYYTFGFTGTGRSQENIVAEAVCPEALRGFATAAYSTVAGDRGPAANDYYYVRDFQKFAREKWKGSVFMIHGLQDWNVEPHMGAPVTDTMEREGYKVKQLWGQWGHMYPDRPGEHRSLPCQAKLTRWDWAEIMLHWFDAELKGLPVETGPKVQIQDSECRWRNEEFFPPHDAHWTTYNLGAGNKLSFEAGASGQVLLTPAPILAATPAGQTARSLPGYLADFSTAPLEKGMSFSGLPRLHVTVTPHGPTGHLAAYLYDVDEKGAEKRVGWTQMNLLYAAGGDQPRPYAPNTQIVAKMEFEPMDAYIQPGHRLLLRIWEYTYADHLPTIPPEPVTLNFGGSVKSTLELPILERGDDVFFTPPQPPEGSKLNPNSGPTSAPTPQ